MNIRPACDRDLPSIVALMNAAFRGIEAERSWSTEAGYITGDRTNEQLLQDEIGDGALFLLARHESTAALEGCVSLLPLTPENWYLGALTVAPALQNSGLGRRLLAAAEEYALLRGAQKMQITVVNIRDTLISWYQRRGYRTTGETRPFPYGDNRFGTPSRDDLSFVVLEKALVAQDS